MITSNHDVILGDQPRKVEINADGNVTSRFEKTFEIEGKDSGASAMVWVCVKGLVGDADPIDVVQHVVQRTECGVEVRRRG